MSAGNDLMATIAAERRAFSNILEVLPTRIGTLPRYARAGGCQVVAHTTMPLRLSTPRFIDERLRSRGDFAHMADRLARHDAQESISTLLHRWRTNGDTRWKPPGGGL